MTIPYEPQLWNDRKQKSCAAAALTMVYKSLGVEVIFVLFYGFPIAKPQIPR